MIRAGTARDADPLLPQAAPLRTAVSRCGITDGIVAGFIAGSVGLGLLGVLVQEGVPQ